MRKPEELFWLLPNKSLWLFLLWLLLNQVPAEFASSEANKLLPPPLPVKTIANTEHSVTLSWKQPNVSLAGVHLTGISIRYSSPTEPEKEIKVSPNTTTKMINDLKPDTHYTTSVTAHYSNDVDVPTENFQMKTLASMNDYQYRDVSCYKTGTRQVERLPSGGRCLCQTGYQGRECDVCSDGFYRTMDKCLPCPCPKDTSLGNCQIGSDEDKIACACKPGYYGMLCDMCLNGYYPVNEYCISCHCLTCDETSDCEQCSDFRLNITDHDAVSRLCGIAGLPNHRTVKHEDGTVAIVAVVISLAFIACVAAGITCYRNRLQARNQVPFWSIELAEDKVSLNAGSDYQRLEGSSKQHLKSGHQRSSSVAEATVAKQRADQPQYNCISI